MARAEASIVINRPVEDVWEYVEDPANAPEWHSGVLESEKISQGPTGVGTTYRAVIMFLGRRLEGTLEVTEYELHKRVRTKMTMGPLSFEETRIFEPVEGGTRFTIIGEGELRGFFRFADPIVWRMAQRDMEGSLAQLKGMLEAEH